MKIAVLDLGTNVFNLLLAQVDQFQYSILEEFKVPAMLGGNGLSSGVLHQSAFESAHAAIESIVNRINERGGVDKIFAFATSAVRDAKNGKEFAESIRQRFGIDVSIISGEREAELISKGIRESMFIYDETVLMMDIGGGSNEFIITKSNQILWKESFPLGMARIKERFMPSNPMTDEEALKIREFFNNSLQSLWDSIDKYKPNLMIGSSGSFDTIRDLLTSQKEESHNNQTDDTLPAMELSFTEMEDLYQRLIGSTREDRLKMKGMSAIRVDYMVMAMILIKLVIERCLPSQLYQSSFSLKEGVMAEIYESMKNR